MRSASLFSIFGLALCVSATIVACGDDDDNKGGTTSGTPSAQGESCSRTADCASGLVCLDDVCQKKGTSGSGGNAGNEGVGGSTGAKGGSGGTGGTAVGGSAGKGGSAGTATTPPPVLGSEGESCTRAADCATGLHCFNQRCTVTENNGAGGEAGGTSTTPPPSVRLGQQGETCTLSSDCADGLACLPTQIGGGLGAIGVCSVSSSGIQPTGMDCHAECKEATDCCELPPSVLTQFNVSSCADLADDLNGVACDTSPGAFAAECFVQATYCQCNPKSWSCDAGRCSYVADCTDAGLTTGGCPLKTRSDSDLVSTCNTDGKCAAEATTGACTKDADCTNKNVADFPSDTCTADECVCYKSQQACYRRCGSDLDCSVGKSCDGKTHVCVADECADDLACQTKNHNIKSICVSGGCKTSCDTDLDCNSLTTALTQVCGADHTCQNIGCSTDADCTSGSVHMFCTTEIAGGGSTVVSSAITNGGTQ